MPTIQNVAILGASGNVGDVVIPKLLSEGYTLTIVLRPDSKPFNLNGIDVEHIRIETASYSDVESMTAVFNGQHAVIEAFNPAAQVHQRSIVKAALAAGVAHLLTPDFTIDRFGPHIEEIPIFNPKLRAQRELEEAIEEAQSEARKHGRPEPQLTWTSVLTSLWYDWSIDAGFSMINKEKRTITRYGSGNQRLSLTRQERCGDYVVAILRNPERYRNRPAYFASTTIAVNELIALVRELAGADDEWSVRDVPLEPQRQAAFKLWDED
ncbi:Uu.00g009380.m01.CDS01 [Anthostomella pinea]|uniref:Uu.00g009380.m01.CDS01 n=1 Tax=Anthostomella pinea TaxID=933095 RepID=A0AAI8VXC4_9PEZI|nr:Uu.00g009380.m01.CDS01 [Anthostomella pinea]